MHMHMHMHTHAHMHMHMHVHTGLSACTMCTTAHIRAHSTA